MFWKGRRAEKRLLELITVRKYFSCGRSPEGPREGNNGRKGADSGSPPAGAGGPSKPSLPSKGRALNARDHHLRHSERDTSLNAHGLHGTKANQTAMF